MLVLSRARSGIGSVALLDHLDILVEAICCIAFHDHSSGPCWRGKRQDHGTEQRIFRLVLWMVFGANEAKGHWQAIPIPVGDQQGEMLSHTDNDPTHSQLECEPSLSGGERKVTFIFRGSEQ